MKKEFVEDKRQQSKKSFLNYFFNFFPLLLLIFSWVCYTMRTKNKRRLSSFTSKRRKNRYNRKKKLNELSSVEVQWITFHFIECPSTENCLRGRMWRLGHGVWNNWRLLKNNWSQRFNNFDNNALSKSFNFFTALNYELYERHPLWP